ncbi:hypothetical protein Hanom_Chr17g01552471 [Helianthus anomalus]
MHEVGSGQGNVLFNEVFNKEGVGSHNDVEKVGNSSEVNIGGGVNLGDGEGNFMSSGNGGSPYTASGSCNIHKSFSHNVVGPSLFKSSGPSLRSKAQRRFQ